MGEESPPLTASASRKRPAPGTFPGEDLAATTGATTSPAADTAIGQVPAGRNISGRIWKNKNQSKRACLQVVKVTKELSTTWDQKMAMRAKRTAVKEKEQEMKDATRQQIEDRKAAKLEKEKRRQQNELKATEFQTLNKPHKLRGMSRKQLRQVKKMQVNRKTGEVELVSPWGGGKK